MFADPQVVTINGVAHSLARTSTNGSSSTYMKNDGTVKLIVSHQRTTTKTGEARIRSVARLEQFAVVANPVTLVNETKSAVTYFVRDFPVTGFTLAQAQQQFAGLFAWGDNTAIAKIVGQET